jgi:hypothetical protein
MFLDHYHLREQPFGVTPDPRFLYLSATHREALASLYYGVEASRGFMALIAEPGMGKTTLLFQLMERVRKSVCFAFLFQTQCDSREFLRYLLADTVDEGSAFLRATPRSSPLALQSALPGPPPPEPRSAPRLAVHSGLEHRPLRIAALAASVLACLVLFPSLWKSLGTQFDRVGPAGATPVARSIGLNPPTPLPAVSTTPPAAQSALADRGLSAVAQTGNPAVIVVVTARKTSY